LSADVPGAAEPQPKSADNDGRKEAQKARIGFCDFCAFLRLDMPNSFWERLAGKRQPYIQMHR
jgi:hypothetical protein